MRIDHSFHVPHRLRWLVGAAVLCATLLALGLVRAQPSPPARAGVVIQFGDGRVTKACVDLGDDGQATGEEALLAAGLPVIVEPGGAGAAVCKVDGEGCDYPATSCFCQCSLGAGTACRYWSYSRLVNGQWQLSNIGASSTLVRAGDVEGWAWGDGTVNSGARPPLTSFNEVCAVAAVASATATTAPPPVVEPSATATQRPPAVYVPLVGQPASSSSPTNVLPASATATVATPSASRTPAAAAAAPLGPTTAPSPSRTLLPTATTAASAPSPTEAVLPLTPSRDTTAFVDEAASATATPLPATPPPPMSPAPSAAPPTTTPSLEQVAAAAQEVPVAPTAANTATQISTPAISASIAAPPTLAPSPMNSPLASPQQRSGEPRAPNAPPASYLALGLLALGLIVGLGVLQMRRR